MPKVLCLTATAIILIISSSSCVYAQNGSDSIDLSALTPDKPVVPVSAAGEESAIFSTPPSNNYAPTFDAPEPQSIFTDHFAATGDATIRFNNGGVLNVGVGANTYNGFTDVSLEYDSGKYSGSLNYDALDYENSRLGFGYSGNTLDVDVEIAPFNPENASVRFQKNN